MDRRSIIKNAGLAGVLAAGIAPAVVHAQANIRWRLTSGFPKALDTIYGAAESFSKKVKDMTGGKFEISVHAAGELVPMPGLVDAVQNGTVEMGHTAPYYYFGKNDAFALGCATGLIAFVRLLRWLLARWHGQTVALLVGVMAGSLWKIWPFRTVLESSTNAKGKLIVLRDALAAPPSASALLVALLLGAIGVLLVVGLEWLQHRVGVAEMGG